MTMTDPIADFLTRLRNANSAYHDEVSLPHSKLKANIAQILKTEGSISDYRTEDARVGKSLIVQLKYGPSRERSIAGLRRGSKPGLRGYAESTNRPPGLGGPGVVGWGGLAGPRLGSRPVPGPAGVDVTSEGQNVSVKGPKGTLNLTVAEP